jgi:hypothetical protein
MEHIMKNEQQADYSKRDRILQLLSDQELAEVSTAETAPGLADGDEYLDLENLDLGVQRAHQIPVAMGRVLSRRAIRTSTWDAILGTLSGLPATPSHSPGI